MSTPATKSSTIQPNYIHVMTDAQAQVVGDFPDIEPEPGSVALTNGMWGTAWQRYFDDGLWHRVGGGRGRTWQWLLTQRNVVVVYDAPLRPEDPNPRNRPSRKGEQ